LCAEERVTSSDNANRLGVPAISFFIWRVLSDGVRKVCPLHGIKDGPDPANYQRLAGYFSQVLEKRVNAVPDALSKGAVGPYSGDADALV
jgi:hypothetical protein